MENYAQGKISLDEALKRITVLNYRTVGEMAKLDICRADRIGIPEAILAEGKEEKDLLKIKQKIDEYLKKKKSVQKQESGILFQLENIEKKVTDLEKEIVKYQKKIEATKQAIDEIKKDKAI